MPNLGRKVKRETAKYKLIRLDDYYKLNCLMNIQTKSFSVPFNMGLLYMALRHPTVMGWGTFDNLASLVMETNNTDFIYLFKECNNRGLRVSIKPLENWHIKYPELSEIL